MTKIGLITIGQSPRSDVVPDMAAVLGGLDAIVFTAGIGERSTHREVVIEALLTSG